jgi:hypothetical protein
MQMSSVWEMVHTIHDWYDGPRAGAAEYLGSVYWYRSVYLDTEAWDPDEDRFELTPMTSEAFSGELERTTLFERWDSARRTGAVVWNNGDDDSFGALPEDMPRYRELNNRMDTYLATTPPLHLVRGTFDLTAKRVQWEPLGSVPEPNKALQRTRSKQRASER